MRKSLWVLNVLLLGSAGGLGWKLGKDWRAYALSQGPWSIQTRPIATASVPGPAPVRDYTVIAQQNPFHPERNGIVVQDEPSRSVGPPPLIYGSVIIGRERFALLGAEGAPKPERVAEGETFNGYKVAHVLPQSIVLQSGAGTTEVLLYNAIERLRREHTKTQPSAATRAESVVQSTGGSAAPAGAAPTSPNTPATPQATQQVPPGPPQPGKRIMQTPFGPIWVEDRRP